MPLLPLVVLVLVTSAVPATPQGSPKPAAAPQQAEAYYEFLRARHLEDQGEVDGALAALRRAGTLDPTSAAVRAELAAVLARAGREVDARRAAEEALALDASNTEANWVLGTVIAARVPSEAGPSPEIDRAIEHLEKARPGRTYDLGLLMMLGRLQLARGNAEAAVDPLRALRQQEPGIPDAGLLLAQAYEGSGRIDDAVGVLREVVADQPRFFRGWTALADLLEKRGDAAAAADAYRQAAGQSPRAGELRLREASAWLAADQPVKARDVLRELVEQSPTEGDVLYLLSEAERRSSGLEEAEAAARRLVALEPKSLRSAYTLALALEARRAYRDVVATLTPALGGQAGSGRQAIAPLVHLAFAHQELGELDKAISAFEGARDLNPSDPSLQMYVGQALLAAKRHDKALDVLSPARAKAPDDLRLARLEAQALRGLGQMDRAIAVLTTFTSKADATPAAFIALASVYSEARRFGDAVRVLNDAEARFPSEADLPFQRGAVLEQQKQYDAAEAAFRVALTKDPIHAPTLNYLGYMLAERGIRLDEAISLIERAVKADPHNGSYLDSLGWALFKKGDVPAARGHLERAVAQAPANSVVQDHFGDVLAASGDTAGAIAAWKAALAGDGEQIDLAAVRRKIDAAQRDRR